LEWEYAADGGQASKGYTYSGSNNADEVNGIGKTPETNTYLETGTGLL
jgi:formylglycine-generating enzyme required for sulfatase activity